MPFINPYTGGVPLAHRSRRRVPLWVRQESTSKIHGIAGHLCREQEIRDLSRAQEWLLEQCFAELEYRWRRERRVWRRCSCAYCIPPFTDEDAGAE